MKILYYLLLAVCYPISLLPFRVHYLFADMLYFLMYYVVGYRRKVVRKNLTASFPEKSEEKLRKIERGFYHFLCDYLHICLIAFHIQEIPPHKFYELICRGYLLLHHQKCVFQYDAELKDNL